MQASAKPSRKPLHFGMSDLSVCIYRIEHLFRDVNILRIDRMPKHGSQSRHGLNHAPWPLSFCLLRPDFQLRRVAFFKRTNAAVKRDDRDIVFDSRIGGVVRPKEALKGMLARRILSTFLRIGYEILEIFDSL